MHQLVSEFGSVAVSVDESGNGPRLRLEDRKSGQVAFLDPLLLECLVWASEEDLARLIDPARTRWASDAADSGEPPLVAESAAPKLRPAREAR